MVKILSCMLTYNSHMSLCVRVYIITALYVKAEEMVILIEH